MLLPASAQSIPDGTVTLPGEAWRALQPPETPRDVLPGPRATSRDARVRWDGKALVARVRWELDAMEPGWMMAPLAAPGLRVESATLDGRPVDLLVKDGAVWFLARIDGPHTLAAEVVSIDDPTRSPLNLGLMPADRGRLTFDVAEGLEGRVASGDAVRVDDTWWVRSDDVVVQVGVPKRKVADRRTLAVASAGVGLTVGEGAVQGKARVRWTLRQGAMSSVALRARGVGSDLEVTGPNVARVSRSGDRVQVELRKPTEGLVDLELTWSVPIEAGAESRIGVPEILPEGAFRTEASLQLARDAEIEVLPEVPGWQAVASSELPDFGEGLIEGTPTAAYVAAAAGKGGSLGLLRFVPAKSPPVVVDVASLTMTVSPEGRSLTRAHYTVRNERASHLRVQPQPGATIVAARVQDGPVTPVADGEAWLIPLPRSLETVDGLLSFPVEVVVLGDGVPWDRHEARDLQLPVVGADVAVNRVTLHLPRGWMPRMEAGEHGTVADFTEGEGISYGFGLGGEKEAEADQYWQDAQAAYMRNDFDEADEILDRLEDIGASNSNMGKLRGNLDVVQGRAGDGNARARRVRDQAKTRAEEDYRAQTEAIQEAEERWAAGEYEQAELAYSTAAKLSKKLDKLEQKESVEQERVAEEAQKKLQEAKVEKARQQIAENAGVLGALGYANDGKDLSVVDGELAGALGGLVGASSNGLPGGLGSVGSGRGGGGRAFEAIVGLDDDEEPALLSVDGTQSRLYDPEATNAWEEPVEAPATVGEIFDIVIEDEFESGGVVGGVEGGVVGGVVAGQAGSIASYGGARSESETVAVEELQRIPSPRRGRMETASVAASRRGGLRLGGGRGRSGRRSTGRRSKAEPAPQAVAPSPETKVAFDDMPIEGNLASPDSLVLAGDDALLDNSADYAFEALEVTSTRESVVVPVLGETLKYQHLLLRAGADHVVHVEARADRSVPRRTE